MVALLSILVVTAIVVSPLPLAAFMLAPARRAGGISGRPIRFVMTDLACLMLLLSFGGAVVSWVARRVEPLTIPTALSFAFFLYLVAVWWAGAQLLSRAGVTDRLRRALLLLVLCPFGILGAVIFPVLVMLTVDFLWSTAEADRPSIQGAFLLVGDVALLAALVACRRAAGWVVRDPSDTVCGQDHHALDFQRPVKRHRIASAKLSKQPHLP